MKLCLLKSDNTFTFVGCLLFLKKAPGDALVVCPTAPTDVGKSLSRTDLAVALVASLRRRAVMQIVRSAVSKFFASLHFSFYRSL